MNTKLIKGVLFFFAVLSGSLAMAQTITGTVTSEGEPLPGASVVVKGTSNGTTTDFDGNYTLSDVGEGAILTASYLGFITKEVSVNGNATVDIVLAEDVAALDEVVVIGYGTRKRSDLTTAVASVDSEKITALPAASVNEALEGRATGVQVRAGGSPGEASTVSIRGINTFGNSTPLYVVDGVFVNDVSGINPNDIEKVDVLKDAAAAAIYGSRGTNGVIIITTKKGKQGKPKVSYTTYTGYQFLQKNRYYDVINSEQLIDLLITEDVRFGDGSEDSPFGVNNTPPRFSEADFVPANTNWQNEVFRSAPITNHDFAVSGANDFAKYRIGAGIFSQDGIQINTDFKRYNFSTNTEFTITDKIKVGQTLNIGYSRQKAPVLEGGEALFQWALKSAGYLAPRTPEGLFTSGDRLRDNITLNQTNPLLIDAINKNQRLRTTIVGSVFADIELAPGLTNRTQVGVNIFDERQNSKIEKYGPELVEGDANRDLKQLQKQTFRNVTTVFTNVLSYNKTFGDHRIDATGIFELTQQKVNTSQIQLVNQDPNIIDEFGSEGVIGDPLVGQELRVRSQFFPNSLVSLAGRLGYSFKEKYILSGSIRRDADGRFGQGFRDAIFPAGSAAWVVSNEGFMEDSFVNNLKLRGSIGVTGNNSSQQFATQPLLDATFGSIGDFTGISVNQVSSPNLTWETSLKTNYGFELGLFQNKFTLEADYFTSKNEELIVVPILDTSEGLNSNFFNRGAVDVKGVELTLGYNDYDGDFKWSTLINVSAADPTIVRIADGLDKEGKEQVSFGAAGGSVPFNIVGEAPFVFFGFETDGLFENVDAAVNGIGQNQAFQEVGTGNPVEREIGASGEFIFTQAGNVIPASNVTLNGETGTFAGDIRYKDQNGDGVIDPKDRVIIGNPNPDFTYSLNWNASYKGFDASLYFTGVQGVDAYNHAKYPITNFISVRNFSINALDRYTATNTGATVERYTPSDPNNNQRISDKYIEDGSYLRIRNISLGYSLSDNDLNNILGGALSKFRIYVQAQNIHTFTKYSGYDPEIRPSFAQGGAINGLNLDEGFSPAPASILTGIQVEF